MKRPFVLLTIPLILGITFYYHFNVEIQLISILFISMIIISLIGIKLKLSIIVPIFFSLFLLGMLITATKADSSKLMDYADRSVELKGVVKDIRSLSEDEGRYVVQVNGILDGEGGRVREKVLLKLLGDKSLKIGDEISFRGVLRKPLANTNPRLFNYKLKLLSEDIQLTMAIRDNSIIDIKEASNSFLIKLKRGFIKRVERGIEPYLNEESSPLIKSILLGSYSYLEEEDLELFRDLGLAHILAVSGLHIGIIARLFTLTMAYLGINRKINMTITLAILWTYAYIIGFPPSILRANIMFSIMLLAQIRRLPYDPMNAMFFALFLLVLINPFSIFDIGLQLSFMATFSILFFMDIIRPTLDLYREGILKPLGVILFVQLGLLPILAYYFNRIPLLSFCSNLILMPVFSLTLMLSIFLVFFSNFTGIAYGIGILINLLLKFQFKIMELLSYFPILNMKLASPAICGIFIYYIIILMLFKLIDIRKLPKGLNKAMVFSLLFLALINIIAYQTDYSMAVEFIDVGQGDSILIRSKDGNYLIDTGGNPFDDFDVGKNIVLPYLEKEGIFKLKGVFISHFDADHCKSLPYLIDNMEIENIYLGYEREENDLYNQILEKAKKRKIPVRLLKQGDKIKVNHNTNIYVVGPNDELLNSSNTSDNDLSLVLLLKYYDYNILFTGDIERLGEEGLMKSLNLDVDFLKVAHHGSNTSSGEDFLKKFKPKVGFMSVGRNNSFNHPHEEVLERYKKHNIELFRTDELGLIRLKLDGDKYEIKPFIRERKSLVGMIRNYWLEIIYLIILSFLSYRLVVEFLLVEEEMEKIELQGIYR